MGRKSRFGIRRSLFGYRPAAVHDLLLESDYVHRSSESTILAAEAKIADLQSDLASMEEEVTRRDGQLRALEEEVATLEDRSTDGGPMFVTHEVTSILAAAQEAAARIVDRARSVSSRMNEANQRDDRLRSDVARLSAWRAEALPVITSVGASLEEVRLELDGVARRILEALEPLEELGEVEVPDDSQHHGGPATEVEADDPAATEPSENGEADRVRAIEQRPRGRSRPASKSDRAEGSRTVTGAVEELTG